MNQMIITKCATIFLIMYSRLYYAATRHESRYNILQSKTESVYVDPYAFRYWPKDSTGMQNMDNLCPMGYTCLPNYIRPPTKKKSIFKKILKAIKNTKFRAKAYSPKTAPGGGCLGLDEYDEVTLESFETGLYMASCVDCIEAKYRNIAMVYSDFKNLDSKWKMIPQNNKCAIKNIKSGMYLSRCENCMSTTRNVPIAALFRETIDDNTNDDLWIVTRKTGNRFRFKSASTGEYLGVCEGCATKKSTIQTPVGLFTTSSDLSIIEWSVNV